MKSFFLLCLIPWAVHGVDRECELFGPGVSSYLKSRSVQHKDAYAFQLILPSDETPLNELASIELLANHRHVILLEHESENLYFMPGLVVLSWPEVLPALENLRKRGLSLESYGAVLMYNLNESALRLNQDRETMEEAARRLEEWEAQFLDRGWLD